MKFIAIDFETANERRSSPCAIGLAWVEDGEVVRREYRLIRPKELRFGYWETKVHGITARDVEHAPEFPDILEEFAPDITGGLLVAHNAGFDIAVMRATAAVYDVQLPQMSFACTLQAAKRTWPEDRSHKLNVLADRLGLSFKHHHASEDALVCAQVLLEAARRAGANTMSDLITNLPLTVGRVDEVESETRTASRARRASRTSAGRGIGFTVRGSQGDLYSISEFKTLQGFDLSCECTGWRMRRRCTHVRNILCGVVDDLVAQSDDAFEQLRAKIAMHDVPEQYRDA